MSLGLLIIILLLSMTALLFGADRLVVGSARLAELIGIPAFVIGLTVVAFGTSLPELVVSVFAALKNDTAIALGNVVGSNIANIGLILGVSALIAPVLVESRTLRREVPFVILASLFFWGLVANGWLSRPQGLLFLLLFGLFLVIAFRSQILPVPEEAVEYVEKEIRFGTGRAVFWVMTGLVLLIAGGHYLMESASELALRMGISKAFVGLTMVAIGTSLPELATSVAAALRRENELILGNVLGSNIFNILLVLGVCGTLSPIPVPQVYLIREIPIMVVFSVALFFLLLTGRRLVRIEGFILLIAYFATVAGLYFAG